MSSLALLTSKSLRFRPHTIPTSPFPWHLFPTISHSLYSTLCSTHTPKPNFSLPQIDPPLPKKLPFKLTAHGRTWDDPYHWISNTNHPDFLSYLTQENSYAEAFMADTRDKQRELFSEMAARVPDRISTPPEQWGPWLYYQYIPEGKEYPVLCRRLDTKGSSWLGSLLGSIRRGFVMDEILLDWNEIAEKYGYVHVGACRVSPDHNYLAYTLDTTGSEQFLLQIKDLRDGHVIPTIKDNCVVSMAWSQDSSILFYTVSDENQRPYRVLCTEVGSESDMDTLVFTEEDSRYCVDITSTKDGKFITINSNSRTSSEVYVMDASNPLGGLRRVHKRIHGVQYFLEHHHGSFHVLTNCPLDGVRGLQNGNLYLAICRVEDINSGEWQNVILPGEGANFQDMDIFDEHLVLFFDKEGSSMICSVNLPIDINCKLGREIDDLSPWIFPVPSDSCRMVPGSNHNYKTSVYRVVLSSPVMPDLIIDYDMKAQKFSIIHQDEVLNATDHTHAESSKAHIDSGFFLSKNKDNDRYTQGVAELQTWKEFSSKYTCEMHEVVSHDGTNVPLTIVFSRDAQRKGQSPGLLEAYGAYGEVLDKSWNSERLSLLDRGWVVAFADVRGGGGGDPSWHQCGSGTRKINSVYDFISCGKYLVNQGYVQRDRLAAVGSSAGSLLLGAAINFHPDLFRAAILKVPFVDICNTLMDVSLPLTILDYEEFGNPKVESEFRAIMEYSPYDNINQGVCYPSMLVTAAFNDSRVGVWEAAKWVAKLRDSTCRSCSRSVILKTEMMSGGHFGEGGRFGQSEEKAYEYSFLMKVMGLLDSAEPSQSKT